MRIQHSLVEMCYELFMRLCDFFFLLLLLFLKRYGEVAPPADSGFRPEYVVDMLWILFYHLNNGYMFNTSSGQVNQMFLVLSA